MTKSFRKGVVSLSIWTKGRFFTKVNTAPKRKKNAFLVLLQRLHFIQQLRAVVPDFFRQFFLFGLLGKWNYLQIKSCVIWALKMHTETPATGYEDINMQEFFKSNVYQYLFADFVRFLMMRWVIPNILGCVFCWKKLIFPLLNKIQITLPKPAVYPQRVNYP